MITRKSPFTSPGGVHPSYHKELTADLPITAIDLPPQLVVPMSQHLGAPAKPLVKKGDTVKKWELIGEASGFISAPVHAPAGGTVTAVETTTSPSGRPCEAVVIQTDPEADSDLLPIHTEWHKVDRKTLVAQIQAAGIVGMGGAGFPTNIKLSPPSDRKIDTLILNGAECEPYLTADHRVMVEHARQIRTGAEIARYILGAKRIRIAVEDNKPASITSLEATFADIEGDVELIILPTIYPQGSEKQQIYSATGREVPSGGLPMDVGCVVENVGTAMAISQAITAGTPLTERVVTVTGDAVANPANLLVPCGTPYATLIEICGGFKTPPVKVISGGPMMGFTLSTLDVATTKTSSGLLSLTKARTSCFSSQACISCGRCVNACPMRLIPSEMSQCIEADEIEAAEQIHLMDCIECGSCAFVCPAHRPLVQHFRRGKAIIMAQRMAARR